jgi:hypothetical protein
MAFESRNGINESIGLLASCTERGPWQSACPLQDPTSRLLIHLHKS